MDSHTHATTYLYSSIQECKESGDHLVSCDVDGFCNACGEQFDSDNVPDTVRSPSSSEPPKECKGKAAARALARIVLDFDTNAYLLFNGYELLDASQDALIPFGYPDVVALRKKLGL